jgi:hypothetical protein
MTQGASVERGPEMVSGRWREAAAVLRARWRGAGRGGTTAGGVNEAGGAGGRPMMTREADFGGRLRQGVYNEWGDSARLNEGGE